MKKGILFLMLWLLATMSFNTYVLADDPIPDPLIFLGPFGPGDDNGTGNPLPKSPVISPVVAQSGHTLYLYSGCDDTTLVLLDEDDEVVYTTGISEGTTQLVLPNSIQGTYELRIQRGQYIFYTEIELCN